MSNIIKIEQDGNVYILRDERPGFGELSIYVNETRTKVCGRDVVKDLAKNCDTKTMGDDTWNHVKVEWMYEKEKIAFKSSVIYVDRTGRGFEVIPPPVEHIEMVVNLTNGLTDWLNPTT